MSIFNQFPWTNFREYNLDWVIRTVQDCKDTVDAALADVSNAVATYFAQHIDTTLTQAGEAADAAATGNKIVSYFASHLDTTLSDNTKAANAASVGTAISNVQMAIPQLDPTLASAQAAAPAATVGNRLTSIENDITNLQNATSHHTYNITLTENPLGTYTCALTALSGMTVSQTAAQMCDDMYDRYGMFINIKEDRDNPTNNSWCLAYNIHTDRTRMYVYFETESFKYTLHMGDLNPVTAVAKS